MDATVTQTGKLKKGGHAVRVDVMEGRAECAELTEGIAEWYVPPATAFKWVPGVHLPACLLAG